MGLVTSPPGYETGWTWWQPDNFYPIDDYRHGFRTWSPPGDADSWFHTNFPYGYPADGPSFSYADVNCLPIGTDPSPYPYTRIEGGFDRPAAGWGTDQAVHLRWMPTGVGVANGDIADLSFWWSTDPNADAGPGFPASGTAGTWTYGASLAYVIGVAPVEVTQIITLPFVSDIPSDAEQVSIRVAASTNAAVAQPVGFGIDWMILGAHSGGIPTRLYPRDDALGNSPRIHPAPRSIQSGNRNSTYY